MWPARGEPARVGPDGLVRVHPSGELLTRAEQAALPPETQKELAASRWMLAVGLTAKMSGTPHVHTHPDYRPGAPPPDPAGDAVG